MRGAKLRLRLWLLLASGFVLAVILLFSLVQQAHAPGALPPRLKVVQDQALPPDAIQALYQDGRVALETDQPIWWSEDSSSVYFRAFQNTWEYCLPCRISKQVRNRYPSSKPPSADLSPAGTAAELILLDVKETALQPASAKTRLPQPPSWDGWVAYQDEAGCWKLAGYLSSSDLLVEWVNFCQVAGLEGLQPVKGRLSPDGRRAAFAAGVDNQSFQSIWLLYLDGSP